MASVRRRRVSTPGKKVTGRTGRASDGCRSWHWPGTCLGTCSRVSTGEVSLVGPERGKRQRVTGPVLAVCQCSVWDFSDRY